MEAADNLEPAPEAARDPAESSDTSESGAGLKGMRSLRRLRDRVERVARELRAVREENAMLQDRISELESSVASAPVEGGVASLLDSDPEALKKKVEGFIQAIDQYLEDNGAAKS